MVDGSPQLSYGIEDKRRTFVRLTAAFRRGISLRQIVEASSGQLLRRDVYAALNGYKVDLSKWSLIDSALSIAEKRHQEKRKRKHRKKPAILPEKQEVTS